jgi:hypothetical protein
MDLRLWTRFPCYYDSLDVRISLLFVLGKDRGRANQSINLMQTSTLNPYG